MHKRSWLSHGKYWEPRPVRYFVNDLMDCHHYLVCFILPSPPPPKVRAPHHEFYRQNVRLGLKSAALLCLGHGFWCVVLKDSHTCVMVVATGGTDMRKRKMWGNFDTVCRFLQKSVGKKSREHQSNQGQCLNFLLHLSWWMAEMKVCFLKWTLSLVSHPACEGTALWGVPMKLSIWLHTAWKHFINN